MNSAQQRTIIELTNRVKELEKWERFAAHLVNECVGQTITLESLEEWLANTK